MLKKWNFAVILTVTNKWGVKRLKFVSHCMINCGETECHIAGQWDLSKERKTT